MYLELLQKILQYQSSNSVLLIEVFIKLFHFEEQQITGILKVLMNLILIYYHEILILIVYGGIGDLMYEERQIFVYDLHRIIKYVYKYKEVAAILLCSGGLP